MSEGFRCIIQGHRAAASKGPKGKARSLAQVSQLSLDKLPKLARLSMDEPDSPVADSSSGLGTTSFSVLPQHPPRQQSGEIALPPDLPSALPKSPQAAPYNDGMSEECLYTARACWLQKSKSGTLSRRRSALQVPKSATTPTLASIQKLGCVGTFF